MNAALDVKKFNDMKKNNKNPFQSKFKGGRYKIIREEKKGAVDTNLIIKNINYKDNFARYEYLPEYWQFKRKMTYSKGTIHIFKCYPSFISGSSVQAEIHWVYLRRLLRFI